MAATKTSGYLWTAEEDSVLREACETYADEDGGLHTGYLIKLRELFPQRSRSAIKHRVRSLIARGKAPKTWARKTPLKLPEWTQADTGWMAGIFDGEGSMGVRFIKPTSSAKALYLTLCVNTDLAILARVRDLAGRTICMHLTRKNRPAHHSPCYQVVVRRQADMEILIKRLLPHVSSTGKRSRMLIALEYIESRKLARRTR